MKLLELEARTYIGKEYRDYLKSQEDAQEEGNEWKRDLGPSSAPKAYPSRILVHPDRVIMAIESYSIEEMINNPEEPQFDSVDLCLEDGIQISLTGDLDDFSTKWNEYFDNK